MPSVRSARNHRATSRLASSRVARAKDRRVAIRAEVERLAASGAEYDLRGIINFFAGKRQTDETRWFCSEVCTHLAQVGGAFTWVKDCGISPATLCSMALARDEVVSHYLATQPA